MIYLQIKTAKSLTDKTFGMILKENSAGLVFKTRFGIHTFFMESPIDVLILDSLNKIVKIERNLKPNRIFIWNLRHDKVIELPAGQVGKLKLEIGDEIKF